MNVHITRFSFKPIAVVAAIATAFAITAFSGVGQARAAEPGDPDFLGTAETFVIIAANTVTDAGPVMATEVHGDVGSTATSPNPVELDPLQVINGAIYADNPTPDPVAMQALADAKVAYGLVAAAIPTESVGTANLALNVAHQVGIIYVYLPGVYNSASDLLLDGDITLDGLNNNDSVFIFQAATQALNVGSGSRVILINGAQACNVYWQVGSSATIGVGAEFVGTILAATSITLDTNATVDGQLLSSNLNAGAVVLDDNYINGQTLCVRTTTTGTTATGTTTTTTSRVDGVTTTTSSSTPPPTPTPAPARGNTTLAFTGNRTLANTGLSAEASESTAKTIRTEVGVLAGLLALGVGSVLVYVGRRKASSTTV